MVDHNQASGSGVAGIAIAGRPYPVLEPPIALTAGAVVLDNDVTANQRGIYIRDASDGIVDGNVARENSSGILILRLSANTAFWDVSDNVVSDNTRPSAAKPPTSGIGIGITGASHLLVWDNIVTGNHPTGPSALSGGIAVVSFGGRSGPPVPPTDNYIVHNVLRGNLPAGIVTDNTGTGNVYVGNS